MAKKPAFLFYSNDFYEGTRTMLPEERACYVDLMVYQHQHDYIPNDIRRIAMYCVGVSEATLEATLEAKFKLCDKGWYNEKLQEVMNDYEEYSKDQSDNGMYGQFIKKLNSDKSIQNLTELKDFIKNVYTRKRLIEDLKINNNYEANLEALLKRCLNTRVESESEDNVAVSFLNNSNNNTAEVSKKTTPTKFNNDTNITDEDLENISKTLNISNLDYDSKKLRLTFFKENFLQLSDTEKKDFCNGHRMLLERLEQALNNFNLHLLNDKNSYPFTYSFYKEWFNTWLKGLSAAEFDIYMTRIRRD